MTDNLIDFKNILWEENPSINHLMIYLNKIKIYDCSILLHTNGWLHISPLHYRLWGEESIADLDLTEDLINQSEDTLKDLRKLFKAIKEWDIEKYYNI